MAQIKLDLFTRPTDQDSMYAEYKKEFENVETVFHKDVGFANYKLEHEHDKTIEIYVQEVFVRSNMRGLRTAAKLTDMAIAHAEHNYKKPVKTVYTTVGVGGATVNSSLRAITEYGFKLIAATPELIYFKKEIDHE